MPSAEKKTGNLFDLLGISLVVFHSVLHIRQNYNYVTVEELLISNDILLVETVVHYLSWYYCYKKAAGDKYFNYIMILLAVLSYVTASPLFFKYYSNNAHEKISYFFSNLAFTVLFHYSRERYFGTTLPIYSDLLFFIMAYLLLFVFVWTFSYELFVKLFHFVELMVSIFYIGFWMSWDSESAPSKMVD